MATSSFWSGTVRGGAPSAEQDASFAGMAAAANLVHKTVEALARGDEDRARRLAAQAAARPFDEHEEIWPGPWAAHYALFERVTDLVEDWPEGDHAWVGALADLMGRVSGRQLDELRHLAAVLDQDARLLSVDDDEARRLRSLAGDADPLAEPSIGVPEDERADYVLDLSRLVLLVRTRLEDLLLDDVTEDGGS